MHLAPRCASISPSLSLGCRSSPPQVTAPLERPADESIRAVADFEAPAAIEHGPRRAHGIGLSNGLMPHEAAPSWPPAVSPRQHGSQRSPKPRVASLRASSPRTAPAYSAPATPLSTMQAHSAEFGAPYDAYETPLVGPGAYGAYEALYPDASERLEGLSEAALSPMHAGGSYSGGLHAFGSYGGGSDACDSYAGGSHDVDAAQIQALREQASALQRRLSSQVRPSPKPTIDRQLQPYWTPSGGARVGLCGGLEPSWAGLYALGDDASGATAADQAEHLHPYWARDAEGGLYATTPAHDFY